MQRTNTHCLGPDCAAIETQTVSIHPLDRVPYLSYCTEAVSVEICHKIQDRKRHPCNKLCSFFFSLLQSLKSMWSFSDGYPMLSIAHITQSVL